MTLDADVPLTVEALRDELGVAPLPPDTPDRARVDLTALVGRPPTAVGLWRFAADVLGVADPSDVPALVRLVTRTRWALGDTAALQPGDVVALRRLIELARGDEPDRLTALARSVLGLAGGQDVLGREGQPSAQVEWSSIAAAAPDVVVLMPCGFALERTIDEHARIARPPEWAGLPAVQAGQVYAVDGSAYFNRPGPRIVTGVLILAEILQPGRFPRTTPPAAWRRLG